jgi:hypothetical protein
MGCIARCLQSKPCNPEEREKFRGVGLAACTLESYLATMHDLLVSLYIVPYAHMIVAHTRIIRTSPHCLSLVVNSLAPKAGQNTATGYISVAGRVNGWVVTEGPEVALHSDQPSRG